MKLRRNKLVSLFLVFSLMMLSANLYAKERRGAKLQITKKNGIQIAGELITVKENSLLLLNTEGWDVSVGIADIKVIRIVRKSKLWTGAGIGLVICGVGGVLAPHLGGASDPWYWSQVGFLTGAAGLLVGAIVGELFGIDKTIQIEGKSDAEIKETLGKLRKKARIRDYR